MLSAVGLFLLTATAHANTLQVGPGKPFATPCAAIAGASAGDTIQIDSAGNYAGDVCAWSTNNLHLVGVGSGRAVIDANGRNSQGKGIWVINGADGTIVENIEFKNASVPDNNGAGIRIDGGSLTLRNCYFHDNQDGILAGSSSGTLLVEFSEFFHNGAGDGFSHNIYVGNYAKFIFRYNYSHGAVIGHLFKSRAAESDVYYNRFGDEATGTASYEIDIPNGGKSYIVGNLIEKGPNAQNSGLVSYQAEGAASGNPSHELFVVNNTMVNDFGRGTFVVVDGSVSVPAVIKNNIFQGSGSVTTQSSAIQANNFSGNAKLVNPATYDYHLQTGSPAIDAGADPGQGAGVSLLPTNQYVHPSCGEGRATTGTAIDIGAYEFNGGNATAPPNAPARCGTPAFPAPSANLSPGSLTFAAQTLNTTSPTKSVSLTNNGNAVLNISSITITGTNAGDFAQTSNCGSSIAAGANCVINATFTPTSSGARSASLSVIDNASGSPHSAALSGSGISPAPVASLSPASLTFSGQNPGTTSAAQHVKLTNSGNATLNISSIATSGDFAQSNTCGANLVAGTNCTISVTFTPTAGGLRTGSLYVTDDGTGSPQKVSLTGTGLAPAASISVSPSSLAFPGTFVGSSAVSQQVKLTNSGNAALAVSGISASGDFSQTNNCGSSLPAGANCSISVAFKPAAGGSRSGSISIADNATGSPQTVGLTGTGMDFSLSASSNSAVIKAGQPANLTLAISPDGGFNQSISFTCDGAPTQSICSVTPSSVTPSSSSAASVSVTISTTASAFGLPGVRLFPPAVDLRPIFLSAALAASIIVALRTRRRTALGFCCVLLLIGFVSGCAGVAGSSTPPPPGPGTGTPAGTYPLIIKGTSGSLVHSITFTLKVN